MGLCFPLIIHVACNRCESCIRLCPTKALYRDVDDYVKVEYDKCGGCGICYLACPYGAIECQGVPTSSRISAD